MIIKTPVPVIIRSAEKMIRRAGSRDPEAVCAAYGIELENMDLQRRLKAYYFYQSRISTIVIDSQITDVFRRVLIAHELGHFALHKKTAMMQGFRELEVLEMRDQSPLETEANLFAAELLLPDEEVLASLKEYTVFETAALMNVPAALLDFKFSLLQAKGFALTPLEIRKPAFLREDLGAYGSPGHFPD